MNAAGLEPARALLAELRQPPHRWGYPVVMKVSPERVAWTCGCCSLVTTSRDLSESPS